MARARTGRNQTTEGEREHRLAVHAAALAGGRTVRQIAEATGVSVGQAHADRQRILKEWRKERLADADEAVAVAERRLDSMLAVAWTQAVSGDLPAMSLVLKIEERRARLLGLDAPVRAELAATIDGRLDLARDVEFIAVRGAVMRALVSHPEARVDVLRELAAITDGEGEGDDDE